MKKKFFVVVLCIITITGITQDRSSLTINTSFSYSFLDELKGKPVIVDLFNSSCKACFLMLPKVNDLQKKFNDRVHFLLIGDEDNNIRSLYKKFETRLNLQLDVRFDSVFFNLYDISSVPRYVWINEKGVISAITNASSLTEGNIELFLQGKFTVSLDDTRPLPFDMKRPYLMQGNGGPDTSFLFRSILSKSGLRTPTIAPVALDFIKGTSTFNALGVSMEQLYLYAYFGKFFWNYSDSLYAQYFQKPIILDDTPVVNDITKYCYSYTMPRDKADRDLLQRALRNDLQNYFGYQVYVTKIKCPYWSVMVLPGKSELLKSKGGKTSFQFNYAGIKAYNIRVAKLVDTMEMLRTDEFQFIDDTGLTFPIDITIEANLLNKKDFFEELQRAGIKVMKAEKEMTVILLKKTPAVIAAR